MKTSNPTIWFVASGILLAGLSPVQAEPSLPGTWQLEFEDTFDGSNLDGTKWKLGQHWAGMAGSAGMAPENVTVSGGTLKIKSEQRTVTYGGATKSYASGEVSSLFNFRQKYGFFEARIKYPAVTGLWPAFWLMPDRGDYGWKDGYYRSYIKFDLTGVNPGTINSAELMVKVSSVESGGNNNVVFMKLDQDSWSESTLTWNNAPTPDPVWITQRWNQATAGQDMTVDVKDYIAQEMSGDKTISFVLADTFMKTKNIKFHSSEAGPQANRPRLVVNGVTYYASEDAYVRWGTLANTNYGNLTTLAVEDSWGDTASTFNGGMEVDIMESLGIWGPDVTQHAVHWDGYGASHQSIGWPDIAYAATGDGFHTYGLYWEGDLLEFYVDGVKTGEMNDPRVMSVSAYLILSLQTGGWGGNNPGPQVNGQVMEVDWVRAWSGSATDASTVVVDNADTGSVSADGTWTASTATSGYHGDDYQHDGNTAKGQKTFRFLPELTGNGDYLVYAQWSASSSWASNAPVDITDADGWVWTETVDQRTNGGAWNLLGGYSLMAGNVEAAIRTDATDGYVIADAMKFVPTDGEAAAIIIDNADGAATAATGTWTASTSTSGYHGSNYQHDGNTGKGSKTFSFLPAISTAGDYLVYCRWTSNPNRADNVPIDVITADGSTVTVLANQQLSGGNWILLGGWSLSPTNAEIRIRTDGTNGYVIADAVKVVSAGQGGGAGGSLDIESEADSYVRSGSSASANFGTSSELWVKEDANSEYDRRTYLRFDLSSATEGIGTAKLRLYPATVGTGVASCTYQVLLVGDDTWSESAITWNNRPSGSTVLATIDGATVQQGVTLEVDLTSAAQSELAGNGKLSVVVIPMTQHVGGHVVFSSQESGANRPVLRITP